MFAWTSHGTELKRFSRQPITRAALAVMLLIPLLYGAMYVWAFWDPTARMADLPVALVNEDVPAARDGEAVHYGRDVVNELVDDASIGWRQVDAATAMAGLSSGAYYFAVTIPASFSHDIVSLGEDEPRSAHIAVTYDDTNSFLASTLGHTAMLQVQQAVNETAGQRAVDTLLVGVGDARDGFATASDGAFVLRDGLRTATDGAKKLNVGADDLASGAAKLAAGTSDLVTGAEALHAGLDAYATGVTTAGDGATLLRQGTQNLSALQAGLAQAADPATGAPALAAGVDTLAGGVTTLATGATSYATGATQFTAGAATWTTGAGSWLKGATAATAAGGDLVTGSNDLKAGAVNLADASSSDSALGRGAASVASGAKSLAAGVHDSDDALAQVEALLQVGHTDDALKVVTALQAQTKQAAARADQLAAGAGQVADGIADVHSGARQLAAGATSLADGWGSVHGALVGGGLDSGLTGLEKAGTQLSAGSSALTAGAAQLTDPATLAQAKALAAGAHTISDAVVAMSTGASDQDTGIPALQAGAMQLEAGFTTSDPTKGLISGATTLRDGSTSLLAGLRAADAGATQVSEGSATIAAKTPELATGLQTATDGADEFGTKLATATDEIPNDSAALRTDRATAIATPVSLTDTHVHEADSWGEGFAPFFISLALWVGALITWLLLRPLQTRALMTSVNGFRMAWGSLNSALVLSLGQVTILLTVMHVSIGLTMKNVVATFALTLLTAAAFFALQQFFQVTLGSAVGKVVVIVLLMVQLASAGGTYPIQTTPDFLQAISPYMPMTYAVTGLREAITGGIEGRFWNSVAVLAAIFVVSLAASSLASSRKRMWTMSRLHPALSI